MNIQGGPLADLGQVYASLSQALLNYIYRLGFTSPCFRELGGWLEDGGAGYRTTEVFGFYIKLFHH